MLSLVIVTHERSPLPSSSCRLLLTPLPTCLQILLQPSLWLPACPDSLYHGVSTISSLHITLLELLWPRNLLWLLLLACQSWSAVILDCC